MAACGRELAERQLAAAGEREHIHIEQVAEQCRVAADDRRFWGDAGAVDEDVQPFADLDEKPLDVRLPFEVGDDRPAADLTGQRF